MPRKFAHRCWRCGFILLEIFSAAVLIAAVLMGLLLARVSSGPLDLAFARDFIQSALYDEATGNYVEIGNAALYWPELQGPLYLQLRNARLMDPHNKPIVSVDEAALSFSRVALLQGKIRPKSIILKSPSLRVSRKEGNVLDFGFGPAGGWGETLPEDDGQNEQVNVMNDILQYISRPGQESVQHSLISRLESFEIEGARLVVEDHVLGLSWYLPNFDAGFFSTADGMSAKFLLELPDSRGKPSRVLAALHYGWDDKKVAVQADVDNLDLVSLAGKMPFLEILRDQDIVLNAKLAAVVDGDLKPMHFDLQADSAAGTLFYADYSDEPVAYSNLHFGLGYDAESGRWKVSNTHVTVRDVTLQAAAVVVPEEQGARASVNLHIDQVAQSAVEGFWPKVLQGDASEEWVVHKMSDGTFKDLNLSFGFVAGQGRALKDAIENLTASFKFEGLSIDYRDPLAAVHKSSGMGTFDMDKDVMDIHVDSARVGGMTIETAHLFFDQLVAEGVGDVDANIHLTGNLKDALAYVSEEPISLRSSSLDFKKVYGMQDLNIHLHFPARKHVKMEDFQIGVEGTLSDVLLPDIVGDLDLTGGPLQMKVGDGKVQVSGKALLEKRDISFSWEEFIRSEGQPYSGKVHAELVVDQTLRQRMGIDLSDFIEGPTPVVVDYTSYAGGKSQAEVAVDMTPTLFFVEPFDFSKKPGVAASAKLTAIFQNKALTDVKGLTAKGTDFSLSSSNFSFRKDKAGETKLSEGNLSSFTLGETKGRLGFQFDQDGAVKMVLDCPFLDIRPFLSEKEAKTEYKAPPMSISVDAAVMRTAEGETVKKAKLYIDIDGQGRFNQFEMDAVAGASTIYLRFKPNNEGKRIFRLETEDAGAALKAFQVYQNIKGGKLVVYAEPIRGVFDRNLTGVAEITNFKVMKAPALTKLLSIMSLPGLLEVLSDDGLAFEKLEAKFNWVYRKNGSLLVLKEGRTSGNSLGLTFDGTFDNALHQVNVNGTLIPMAGVNGFIGKIPLVGDILTGGSGGVFAATYSFKGKSSDPEVSVNPLSVLAPGILRRILFE
ncbi:MAG: hypothetical protein KDI13_01935 [Alphaproteobacteria bacterium]|nr:hypothetical protein [Alphaproteobacteria bacterium]